MSLLASMCSGDCLYEAEREQVAHVYWLPPNELACCWRGDLRVFIDQRNGRPRCPGDP